MVVFVLALGAGSASAQITVAGKAGFPGIGAPISKTLGDTVMLKVSGTSTTTPVADSVTFHWFTRTTATGSITLSTNTTAATDSLKVGFDSLGTYFYGVRAYGWQGGVKKDSVTSASFTISVGLKAAPIIVITPGLKDTIIVGDTSTWVDKAGKASWTVAAKVARTGDTATVGSGTRLSYQWFRNGLRSNSGGTPVSGATTTTYSPDSATFGSYYYYVEVSGLASDSVQGKTYAHVDSATLTSVKSPAVMFRVSVGKSEAHDKALDTLWNAIRLANTVDTSVRTNLNLLSAFNANAGGLSVKWRDSTLYDASWTKADSLNADSTLLISGTTGSVKRLKYDGNDVEKVLFANIYNAGALKEYTRTDGTKDTILAGDTVFYRFNIKIPKSDDISNRISFPGKTVTFNNGQQRIDAATIPALGTGTAVAGTYRYSYHSAADATDLLFSGTVRNLTANAASLGMGSGTTIDPGVVNAGTYYVKVRLDGTGAGAFGVGGEKIAKFEIVGKSVQNNWITLTAGTYTYNGSQQQAAGFTVKDGNVTLFPNVDYEVVPLGAGENVNAGTGYFRIAGKGNYKDTAVATFTIGKAVLTASASYTGQRIYTGSTAVDTNDLAINFAGALENLVLRDDYKINSAVYTHTPAGSATVAGATADIVVELLPSGTFAKNYTFAAGAVTATIKATGWAIAKKNLDPKEVKITIPEGHRYTGVARPIPVVFSDTLKQRVGDPTGTLTVVYTYDPSHPVTGTGPGGKGIDGDTTLVPVDSGSYAVSVRVAGGTNFNTNLAPIGTYVIEPKFRVLGSRTLSPAATSGDTTSIKATVIQALTSAMYSDSGTLSYQWYKDSVSLGTSGRDSSYIVASSKVRDTANYYVRVINAYPGQANDTVFSDTRVVVVGDSARSIATANVTVSDEFEYDGTPKLPTLVTVIMRTGAAVETLVEGTDYTLTATGNVNATTRATLRVIGAGDFGSFTQKPFTILPKTLEPAADVSFVSAVDYTGEPQAVKVTPVDGPGDVTRTGLGAVSAAVYIDETSGDTVKANSGVPVNAGNYDVWVKIAAGTNFTASDTSAFFNLGTYTILVKTAVKADFSGYTIPTRPVSIEDAPVKIDTVVLKAYSGKLTVLYNGEEEAPTEPGTYVVTVDVEGDDNYWPALVELGSFSIYDPNDPNGVKSGDRVIPGSKDEVAVVAPVLVVAGEFTAGPNPVVKAAGKVGFFWQGKALTKGTLYVFDASGNLVKKVAIADKGISTARREIGSWKLGTVAEGTYLVKGVLVGKDGVKVKVSSLVGVR